MSKSALKNKKKREAKKYVVVSLAWTLCSLAPSLLILFASPLPSMYDPFISLAPALLICLPPRLLFM